MNNDSPTAGTNSPAVEAGTATPPGDGVAPTAAAAATSPAAVPAPASAPAVQPTVPNADGKPVGTQSTPTEYTDFTAPEGIKLDAEVIGEFKAFAKEKNISQEDAQKFVDMGAKIAQKTQAAYLEQMEQVQAKWINDSCADKEFGGDKLSENLAMAKKALDAFGGEELTKLLKESGLGNHPEIIRYNFRVAQAISEDRLVPGGAKPAGGDPLSKMYPSMVKN